MVIISNIVVRRIGIAIAVSLAVSLTTSFASAQTLGLPQSVEQTDDLAQLATWNPATPKQVAGEFKKWLKEENTSKRLAKEISDLFNKRFTGEPSNVGFQGELIDDIINAIVIARPDVNQVRETLRLQRNSTRPPDFSSLLDNPQEETFLRNHVRLFFGRWLAQNEFYDEALVHFQQLDVDTVLDRPTLLFYRGLMEHQLLLKDDCLGTVSKLLENPNTLPRRYEVLSKLMLADIKPLETDSLDEISRLMGDIRRRTDLSRSGKRVLEREEEVIKKLDKLIEELESKQESQAASSSIAPSNPLQDSFRTQGKGSGQVTSKQQADGGEWGDLPPADRAAALAEMAKDMPPHYRAVIEEYFKRLATENE